MSKGRGGRPWRRLRAAVLASSDVCHLCGERIDMGVRWPDPMSASVDHIIPLASGGTNHRSNLAPAHLGHNSGKRDRMTSVATSEAW